MLRSLPLQQLDKTLSPWRSLPRSRPSGGWLRAVRQALGMTTRQLAKAVGVTQAAVVDAERTEAKGDITLTTLQRYAAALGCELTYALLLTELAGQRFKWGRGSLVAANELRALHRCTPGGRCWRLSAPSSFFWITRDFLRKLAGLPKRNQLLLIF
jgi:transcriptional regulator with XRE-family HTH domain